MRRPFSLGATKLQNKTPVPLKVKYKHDTFIELRFFLNWLQKQQNLIFFLFLIKELSFYTYACCITAQS